MKKILLTGDSGLLGANLCYLMRDRYDIVGISRGDIHIKGIRHIKCDLCDETRIAYVFEKEQPDIVVNTAASVDVDGCENQPEMGRRLNAMTVEIISRQAKRCDAYLLHISTDGFYYNQNNSHLSKESDTLSINNEYTRTKYEGELFALSHEKSLVLRTNFYGFNLQNKTSLGEWILRTLREDKTLTMATDIFFSPIFIQDLASVIENAMRLELTGLYNAGCTGSISKYDFALRLKEKFGLNTGEIIPVSLKSLNLVAWRSNNMAMDNQAISKVLRIRIPTALESLDHFYQAEQSGYPQAIKKEGIYESFSGTSPFRSMDD